MKPAVFVAMPLLRAIIFIIALMVQALPVAVVAQDEAQPKCGMSCCAALATTCSCSKPTEAPALPAPASTAPVTGRELVPATLWVAFTHFLPLETPTKEPNARLHAFGADTQPPVRLSVLFRAILI